MRFIIFSVILFATSQSFAQNVQLLRGFNAAAKAVSSSASVTESAAARFLISQASAARITGVSSAALRSVDGLEAALNRILQSNNTDLKAKTTNFLEAVQAATSQIENGRPVTDVLRTSLNTDALSTTAQKAAAQVEAAEAARADSVAQEKRTIINRIDDFTKAALQRFRGASSDTIAKINEASSELKAAADKGVKILGVGATECMGSWDAGATPQLKSFVNILSHTDDASNQREAFANLSSGVKAELGVESRSEIAARLSTLSDPANCQALSPAATAGG